MPGVQGGQSIEPDVFTGFRMDKTFLKIFLVKERSREYPFGMQCF
jgi:hypothetical protein